MIEKNNYFSFSKLSSFNTCRHGFNKRYLENKKGIGNCFSSYGLLIHSVLERYAQRKINLWDLPDVFKQEFDAEIPESFPDTKYCPDMRQLYYKQGLNFFSNFHGHPNVKILEIESNFEIKVNDWVLVGVIDLVYEDQDGGLVIVDYKSKSAFKTKKEQREYARQLYLYSLYIREKYGRYPNILKFTMIRKSNEIDIPFNKEEFEEALRWAQSTVQSIRDCFDYYPSPNDFFCGHLCNFREECEFKPQCGNSKRKKN